ncbi:MAG TPA: type II secretion system protein [Patescibacteria group bacterium]|nr:type II secretion system protein [Patescibacteria group bacterium]
MNKQKGQTLIEMLVGLTAGVIVVGAITLATITSLSNEEYSKNQNLATQYAQQAMEMIRNMHETNFSSFNALSGSYCIGKTCTSVNASQSSPNPNGTYCWVAPPTGCGQNTDIFVRQVSFEQRSSYCNNVDTKVTVSVSWFDSKCTTASNTFCHSTSLATCLSSS